MRYLGGRDATINDLESALGVESDCDGDSMGVGLESLTVEEREEETRAVFITGSFSACVRFLPSSSVGRNNESCSWKSLFFYRCTDVILFAPLKSQGADSRLRYIHKRTAGAKPPPCSPKSIYVLAKLVGQHSTKRLTHDFDVST